METKQQPITKLLSISDHNKYIKADVSVVLNQLSNFDLLVLLNNIELLEENLLNSTFLINPTEIITDDGVNLSNVRVLFNGSLNSFESYFDKLNKKTQNLEIEENQIEFYKRYYGQVIEGINEFLFEKIFGLQIKTNNKILLKEDLQKAKNNLYQIYEKAKEEYFKLKRNEYISKKFKGNPELKKEMDDSIKEKERQEKQRIKIEITDLEEKQKALLNLQNKRNKWIEDYKQTKFNEEYQNSNQYKDYDLKEFQKSVGMNEPQFSDLKVLNIERIKEGFEKIDLVAMELRKKLDQLYKNDWIDCYFIACCFNIVDFLIDNKNKSNFNNLINISEQRNSYGRNLINRLFLFFEHLIFRKNDKECNQLVKKIFQLGLNFNSINFEQRDDFNFRYCFIPHGSYNSKFTKNNIIKFIKGVNLDLTRKNPDAGRELYEIIMDQCDEAYDYFVGNVESPSSVKSSIAKIKDLNLLIKEITNIYNNQKRAQDPNWEDIEPKKYTEYKIVNGKAVEIKDKPENSINDLDNNQVTENNLTNPNPRRMSFDGDGLNKKNGLGN